MVKEIEYTTPDGTKAKAAYMTSGGAYPLVAYREKFAQLCAVGELPLDAYCQAYGVEPKPDTIETIKARVSLLVHDTTIVLRIQELKRPVLRKLARKIEYNLQKALEQCQVAYDLAYEQGDPKGILAAIRMQAELSKMLSQDVNVTHRYGVLDEESTELLLAMKREIEVRRARGNRTLKVAAEKVETVPEEGQAPSLESLIGSHPEAVGN